MLIHEKTCVIPIFSSRINELYTSLSEQTRKREEGLHTVDMVLREKDHAIQADRLQMTAKVTDTAEDINKRLLAKEMKIREEIQAKFLQLEKVLLCSPLITHLVIGSAVAQWQSAQLETKGSQVEHLGRHCVVSLSKNINPSLVLGSTKEDLSLYN